ncbi:MAG TPA: porin [Polyangia bacterium]|nr:porin [Polyangia bacterium]
MSRISVPALALLLGVTLAAPRVRAAEPPAAGGETQAPLSPAETQAAAAQREAQEAEAQVIELRRQLQALERQQAGYDDVRRRLDQLDARQAEAERQAAATHDGQAPETSVIRFKDGGFEIRSPDNGFYLHPLLRIQGIYTGEIASRGAMDAAAPNTSSFSLGRAEVILEGHVGGPFFQYRLQVDAAQPQPLKDAYVTWRPHRSVAIELGQFKVPYGLQRQYWRADLEFVDLASATAAFSLNRDLGLMAVGRVLPGRLTVWAGLLNGSGPNQPNDNFDLAYALRVVATPFGPLPVTEGDIEDHRRPRLSVGASGYYNLAVTDIRTRDPNASVDVVGNGRIDNVGLWPGAVELRALWRGAALQAEWFGRLEDAGVAVPSGSRKYWGGYVEASAFILPHRLQIAARVSHTDLPMYGASALQRAQAGTYQNEQSGAVSAYIHGHRVKAQVEFNHLTSDGQTAPTAEQVRAALQIGF